MKTKCLMDMNQFHPKREQVLTNHSHDHHLLFMETNKKRWTKTIPIIMRHYYSISMFKVLSNRTCQCIAFTLPLNKTSISIPFILFITRQDICLFMQRPSSWNPSLPVVSSSGPTSWQGRQGSEAS